MKKILLLSFITPAILFGYNNMHLSRLLDSKKCRKCDLSGAPLEGRDLSYALISESDLSKSRLRDAILDSANAEKSNLEKANLSHMSAIETNFRYANFLHAKVEGTEFSGSDRTGATWIDGSICLNKDCSQTSKEELRLTHKKPTKTKLDEFGAPIKQAKVAHDLVLDDVDDEEVIPVAIDEITQSRILSPNQIKRAALAHINNAVEQKEIKEAQEIAVTQPPLKPSSWVEQKDAQQPESYDLTDIAIFDNESAHSMLPQQEPAQEQPQEEPVEDFVAIAPQEPVFISAAAQISSSDEVTPIAKKHKKKTRKHKSLKRSNRIESGLTLSDVTGKEQKEAQEASEIISMFIPQDEYVAQETPRPATPALPTPAPEPIQEEEPRIEPTAPRVPTPHVSEEAEKKTAEVTPLPAEVQNPQEPPVHEEAGEMDEVAQNIAKLMATGACEGCYLVGGDLSNKNLTKFHLRGANLTNTNLDHTILVQSDLRETIGASLETADVMGAWLPDGSISLNSTGTRRLYRQNGEQRIVTDKPLHQENNDEDSLEECYKCCW